MHRLPALAAWRVFLVPGRPVSSRELPARQGLRVIKVGAHLLHTQLQQLDQLPGHAERLVKGALQHVLLTGQLEAHAPQAPPHALAQERLHLGPGVPVLRALGADHPRK